MYGGTILLVMMAALLAVAADAQSTVHFYRYELPTPTCAPDQFKGELGGVSGVKGPFHRVETDSAGRLMRSQSMREGKTTGDYTIRYAGETRRMVEWSSATAGRTSIHRCVRDAKGLVLRDEILNAAGALTEIERISPPYSPNSGGREGWIGYTPDGKVTAKEIDYFDASGVLIMFQAEFPGDPNFHETTFDPNTGLAQRLQLFGLGTHKLLRTDQYTYDQNGDRIRTDIYDATGKLHGVSDYASGLESRRQYRQRDGSTEEYRYAYDDERNLKEATLTVGGRLICKFVYLRSPDGAVLKTEARGPDGALWAVYPNRVVREVTTSGLDPSNSNSKIIRTGNWR